MFLISYMYTYIIIGFMDLGKQISRAFWQGMVELVIWHQTGQEPVYGGKLSKYLRNQAHEISPGSLSPLLYILKRPISCIPGSGSLKGGPANIMSSTLKGKFVCTPCARNLAEKSGRLSWMACRMALRVSQDSLTMQPDFHKQSCS